MLIFTRPRNTENNLKLYLDSANLASYNGGSVWKDLSDSKNHLTLINSPSFVESDGTSLYFNGTTQHGEFANNLSFGTGDLSFEFVIKYVITGEFKALLSSNNNIYTNNLWVRGSGGAPNMHFLRRTTGTSYYGDSAWGGTTGIYVNTTLYTKSIYFATTHNATTGEFKSYVNGTLWRTRDGFYNNQTASVTGYGSIYTPDGSYKLAYPYLECNVSIFKSYDKVLSQEEVTTNFNYIRKRFNL